MTWLKPAGWLLLLALLTGCATSKPKVLDYHVLDAPGVKATLWPSPPDVPRYMFGGYLIGADNFREPEGGLSFLQRLKAFLFGDDPPNLLQRPQGVAVDALGRVVVSDISRAAVLVFDQVQGNLLVWSQADKDGTQFLAPSGIAIGDQGDIFVSDPALGVVVRLNQAGEPQQSYGRDVLKRPTGVLFDRATRTLLVSDTYNHVLREFDLDGRLLRTIGERGDGPGAFNFPTYLAMLDDELFVSDTMNARIQVLRRSDGQPLRSIGERGTYVGQIGLPKGIALDSEGNLYVVESMFEHLLVFDRQGAFLMGIGGNGFGRGQFYLPGGVWVDDKDRVLVADMFNGRISVFQFLGGGDHRGFNH